MCIAEAASNDVNTSLLYLSRFFRCLYFTLVFIFYFYSLHLKAFFCTFYSLHCQNRLVTFSASADNDTTYKNYYRERESQPQREVLVREKTCSSDMEEESEPGNKDASYSEKQDIPHPGPYFLLKRTV